MTEIKQEKLIECGFDIATIMVCYNNPKFFISKHDDSDSLSYYDLLIKEDDNIVDTYEDEFNENEIKELLRKEE